MIILVKVSMWLVNFVGKKEEAFLLSRKIRLNYIMIVFSKQSIMKGLNAGSKLSPKYHKDILSPKVYAKMPILIWYCNSFFFFSKLH